jgi:predicted CoA-binding protein
MPDASSSDLAPILQNASVIAVVGCSARRTRTSHQIARYLQNHGYRIIPVNPNHDEVLGEACYPDLPSIPADVTIDVVNIFRRPEHTADMVRGALERIDTTGEDPVIWTQIGVSSPEAHNLADDAGLVYVRNRCIKIEHGRNV